MAEDQHETKEALSAEPSPKPQNEQLQLIAQKLKEKPTDPDVVTLFWRTFMDDITKRIGIDPIEVPPVNKTTEELDQLQNEGRIMVYNPAISYELLERAFPDLDIVNGFDGPARNPIEDAVVAAEGGNLKPTWCDIGIESEDRSSVERYFFESSKIPKRSARLSSYILGSQANRLITGDFLCFDSAKMANTHYKSKGHPKVTADFEPGGRIIIGRSAVDKFYDDLPEWAG